MSALAERNEARECEEIFHDKSIKQEKEIEHLRHNLKYCYNKAYILHNTQNLDLCRVDILKLFESVQEFK